MAPPVAPPDKCLGGESADHGPRCWLCTQEVLGMKDRVGSSTAMGLSTASSVYQLCDGGQVAQPL